MNFTEEARKIMERRFVGSLPNHLTALETDIAAALKVAYERGRKGEREKNARILADPCVQKLRPDEPFFVLLGRDPDAQEALEKWVRCRWQREGSTGKVITAEMTISDFIDYQRNQP